MKPSAILTALSLSLAAHASWFGGEPSASSAAAQASAWSAEQYAKAQQVFHGLAADAFDAWDESRLREFLLEQGVVEPRGTREQLALLAKHKYASFTSAASAYSAGASKSAMSLASAASTAAYGDSRYQASKSISSTYAQATNDISRKLDDTKDYVYSTWDDNQLRSYLEEKGVIKTKSQAKRDELLAKMRETYAKATNPVWQAWSDSYIREWLISHGLMRSDAQKTRDDLAASMNKYYYDTKDTAHTTWSDSQMKDWLVSQGVIKSNAQLQREKLQKLVADNYANAQDTVWGAWGESDMRTWLVEHGYLRSDAEKTRDELVALMHDKYNDYSARSAPYLVWPDARLRAHLREHGMSEDALPSSRPSLLQETRIRWVQTQHRAGSLYSTILHIIMSGVETAEEKLGMILDLVTGSAEHAKARSQETYDDAAAYAHGKADGARGYADAKFDEASGRYADAKQRVGEKAGETESAGRQYWNDRVEDAKRAADHAKVEL
ncbi:hypothetical protein PHLGIDRAFT_32539 [Phlebiopsis gigantea 11061_1 CR5-6]|uniref:Uncharacterized protein n=1 Tax=Phlebiopsis gigantea (strain 11061_1 CR5-6) TaxID=745531 RepID=A0A0C3RYU3_PHLG1|nr:hypothetical protein PHLGIDRAFT_32539 [Phlebiopsis gigantea 11061_1 CR5-6]